MLRNVWERRGELALMRALGFSTSSIGWMVLIENGALVACGQRSHLFYVGDDKPFVNFEFRAEVMTKPGSNAGIYFHTKYQETGWPKFGYEAQVNNSHRDPKRTGSLYAVVNVLEAPAKDDEWFRFCIRVEGKRITIKVNGKELVNYTEPADKVAGKDFTRVLDKGTFALQAHDPKSTVLFRKLQVRRLP
ncbi:MAG: DUF1080 domain-containing protein [Planctomycetes bacterium]|nr:DUF1080 domain-containing protein [Planctomycetota bacterium]